MKEKQYPIGCCIDGPDRRPIILITHDESIFSANDGRHQAWIGENGTFKRPKGKGKGIMVSDFLLPWSRLNLLSLPKETQDELVASGLSLEAVEYFEYSKENGYWDGRRLLEQIENKALPIAKAVYPGYQFLFLFDNATSHSVCADDALCVSEINKGEGGQQPILRDGWYKDGDTLIRQEMFYTITNPATGIVEKVPKGIQRILEERKQWPAEGRNLECKPPRCEYCSGLVNCRNCIKGKRCDTCKTKIVHSGQSQCTSKRRCDNCVHRKKICKCVPKQVCSSCKDRAERGCKDCDLLPPKCTSKSQLILLFCWRYANLSTDTSF
jgi:hypothetical protein